MAGPSIGTWVKVRSKSGGTTPRVLAKKFGGGAYQQGQVITQSEYNSYKKDRAEAKKAETSASSGSGSGDRRQARQARIAEIQSNIGNRADQQFSRALTRGRARGEDSVQISRRADNTRAGRTAQQLTSRQRRQQEANQAAMATGSGNRARRRAGQNVPTARIPFPFAVDARTSSRLPGVNVPASRRRRRRNA